MGKRSSTLRVARLAISGSLALASAGALTGAILLAGAQSASASTSSGTIPYSCTLPTGTVTLNIGVNATAPSSVAPGGSVTLTNVQTSTTIPANLISLLITLEHLKSLAGTVVTFNINATNATPSTLNAGNNVTFNVPVTSGSPATIVVPASPETVGPWTAGSSGTVTLVPGNVVIHSKLGSSPLVINCTAPSSIPASETLSIPISSSTATSVPSTTVPATHTGEPWAGWPYWAIVGLVGVIGLGSFERAARIRRRRA